ncbi:hypothetical protein ASE14_09525 [Agromyces sp. Root81]|uniref:hypothetical protein n=1 Tax=Agromyces sp. Root81 TaxID=1736601 RepID=UPI0006F6731B|nr:hypothetical protein [Agromyces sp. Root81]KRC61158.1 hypothetical protein ASE14_09525 [Agromyces sp. Root81]
MSDANQEAKKRERRRRLEGRPIVLVAAVAACLATAVCAVALGIMIGATAEDIRHSIIDSVFDDRDGGPVFWGVATPAYLWIMGTFGLLASGAGASWLIDGYRGGEPVPFILPPAIALVVAAVVTVDATTWLEPLRVGTRVDPEFHHDETWDAGSWVAYAANIWVPILLVVVAAAGIVFAVLHSRRLREQRMLRTRLLRDGYRVRGVIRSVAPRTATNDVGQRTVIGATVVVAFVDADGVERRVTRLVRRRDLVPLLSGVEVLSDPTRPGDERSTFLSFDRDPAPAEWVGATD